MLLCCLWRNIEWLLVISTSSSFPVKNKHYRLPSTSVNSLRSWVCSTWQSNRSQHAMEPDIGWESRFYLSHLHSMLPTCIWCSPLAEFPLEYCHNVWYGQTRMVWLPNCETFWRYVYSFWQNMWMWQTDGRTYTACQHRLHLHSITRQKALDKPICH